MAGYMATAKRDDWGTPQKLFDELNRGIQFYPGCRRKRLKPQMPDIFYKGNQRSDTELGRIFRLHQSALRQMSV